MVSCLYITNNQLGANITWTTAIVRKAWISKVGKVGKEKPVVSELLLISDLFSDFDKKRYGLNCAASLPQLNSSIWTNCMGATSRAPAGMCNPFLRSKSRTKNETSICTQWSSEKQNHRTKGFYLQLEVHKLKLIIVIPNNTNPPPVQ